LYRERCGEDASSALGAGRRKFYSCAAIEKKKFSLCGRAKTHI
jgi:hypothetical protein